MSKELELWNFVAWRLRRDKRVMLLIVAESSGSSPGRAGYKMAIAAHGELCGSIGGGLMEMRLVEKARALLSEPPAVAGGLTSILIEQEHRKNSDHPSGMICSGEQMMIFKQLTLKDLPAVELAINALNDERRDQLTISGNKFVVDADIESHDDLRFEKVSETDFIYTEKLGPKNELYIVGGGHCALALSELISRMDFYIRIFDDRPQLNTIQKNRFADEIMIVDNYDAIAAHVPSGKNAYVVVMTLGYASDEVVVRKLIDRDLKYFGVLGSKAKMATLLKALKNEGFDADKLAKIRTPIGIEINSRTPEEIAVSIAAEIISIKNKAGPPA